MAPDTTTGPGVDEARRSQIAENLQRVRARIATACAAVDRDPDSVTLIAVTKTYPAADVAHLVSLGVCDVGENRDQEAAPKAAASAAAGVEPRWHYIGQLQRNKARSVASYASVVHSVDRAAARGGVGGRTGCFRLCRTPGRPGAVQS